MPAKFGIYVHVPWCRRRCSYCDFYFEIGRPAQEFSQNLLSEYSSRIHLWSGQIADSLYFGGGTPSLMLPEEVHFITDKLGELGAIRPGAEITLEANPEDVTLPKMEKFVRAGINRVSLGIQSFDNDILKQLGRKHRFEDAFRAISDCKQAQVRSISVDLITGVPGEKPENFESWIKELKLMGINHLSAYSLTVEKGTNLEKLIFQKKRRAPDDDKQAEAYELIQEIAQNQGFRQYEVSSFALPGNEGVHNRIYWGKGTYLGLGPAAHSMRILPDGQVERSQNRVSIDGWQQEITSYARESEILSNQEAFLEAVAFGIRDIVSGVFLEDLMIKHRCEPIIVLNKVFEDAESKGWIIKKKSEKGESFHLTQIGVRFADAIARNILSVIA